MLQPLLQHWELLLQCMPVAVQLLPAGTPASMFFSLTSPLVICTVLEDNRLRLPMHGTALMASRKASRAAMTCMAFMLPNHACMRKYFASVLLSRAFVPADFSSTGFKVCTYMLQRSQQQRLCNVICVA